MPKVFSKTTLSRPAAKIRPRRPGIIAAGLTGALAVLSCGNNYFTDWPPSYRQELIAVGDVRQEVGARALALAGAGRAGIYGADAAASNPAALAALEGPALSGGGGYVSRGLTVQPDPGDLRAQSFSGSFADGYVAAAWPVSPGRGAVAAALWTPNDYTFQLGGEGAGGSIVSRGALYAAGPAAAVRVAGVALGVAGDFLWGGQTLSSGVAGVGNADVSARGYDIRAGVQKDIELAPGWDLAVAGLGRKGGDVHFRGSAAYDVVFPPAAGVAFSLRAHSINVHADYIYTFYGEMRSSDGGLSRVIEAATRDVGWAMVGAEYVTASGAVARAGFGYVPWYILSARGRGVNSLRYGFGGGWPMMARRGRLDAALAYGRRGALDVDGYFLDTVEFQLGVNYFW